MRNPLTCEVSLYPMFKAVPDTIQSNFPLGILQSDLRCSNKYYPLSDGDKYRML